MKKTLLSLILFFATALTANAATYSPLDPFSNQGSNITAGQSSTFCSGATCTYTPLEPFSAWDAKAGAYNSFEYYVNTVFKLLITIGALFAVVMLVVAGIGYMVSEAAVDIQKAKDRAIAALWGLLLLTGCWLILYTINPDLLKFKLNIPMAPGGTYNGSSFGPGSAGSGGTGQKETNPTACGNDPNNAGGCSADSYCGSVLLLDGNASEQCLPNTNKEANKDCTDSGGQWYQDMSGSYCYLSAVKTKEACDSSGGKWQSRWFTTSYCYK